MVFTPGSYTPDGLPPAGGGEGDTIDIDPAALAKLKKALEDAASELETDRFADIELAETAFGASATAQTLGAEHRTAHRIIADTIQGVVTDLWGYRDGVAQFEAGMGSADETAADDLRTREAAVDALVSSAGSNNGEARYRNSQVNHLPAGPGPKGADTGTGSDGPGEGGEG